MTKKNQMLGRIAEEKVEEILRDKGYEILERNYHSPYGEIDIIAQDGEDTVFVEVKSRTSNRFGSPWEAITEGKKQHIIQTALYYLSEKELKDKNCRFDVAAVFFIKAKEGIKNKVQLLENAFCVEEGGIF